MLRSVLFVYVSFLVFISWPAVAAEDDAPRSQAASLTDFVGVYTNNAAKQTVNGDNWNEWVALSTLRDEGYMLIRYDRMAASKAWPKDFPQQHPDRKPYLQLTGGKRIGRDVVFPSIDGVVYAYHLQERNGRICLIRGHFADGQKLQKAEEERPNLTAFMLPEYQKTDVLPGALDFVGDYAEGFFGYITGEYRRSMSVKIRVTSDGTYSMTLKTTSNMRDEGLKVLGNELLQGGYIFRQQLIFTDQNGKQRQFYLRLGNRRSPTLAMGSRDEWIAKQEKIAAYKRGELKDDEAHIAVFMAIDGKTWNKVATTLPMD